MCRAVRDGCIGYFVENCIVYLTGYTSCMTFVGNVHLAAGTADLIPHVIGLLQEEGIETEANPDVLVRTYAQFGVDEARELRDRTLSRALSGRRAFVLAMPSMTMEAQNALLKTLEEPVGDALFIFILPAPDTLLATLRSRAQMLRIDTVVTPNTLTMTVRANPVSVTTHPDAADFLSATPAKRLDMLKPLLEKGDDDRRDLSSILMFLSSLECMLGEHIKKEPGARMGLEAVYRARSFLGDKGSLVKPLLEQVALLVPRV